MNSKTCLFLILNLFVIITVAQDSVKLSSEFKLPEKCISTSPFLFDKGDAIKMSMPKNLESISIRLFDRKGNLLKEKEVKRKIFFDSDVKFVADVRFKNKYYSMFHQNFGDEVGLSAIELSIEKFDLNEKAKTVYKSSKKVRTYYSAVEVPAPLISQYSSGYSYVMSEDKQQILFAYTHAPLERNDEINKDVIGLHILDENLDVKWAADVEMPYTESKMDNIDYMLTDDGTVFFLTKVYDGVGVTKENRNPEGHLELMFYNKEGVVKPIPINLDTNLFVSIHLYENPLHEVFLMGHYKHFENGVPVGLYIQKWNAREGRFEMTRHGFYEFPLSGKTQEFLAVFTLADNSMRVILEEHYIIGGVPRVGEMGMGTLPGGHVTSSSGMIGGQEVFADVIVLNIDPSGKLAWTKELRKYQIHTPYDLYAPWGSANIAMKDDVVEILYVEDNTDLRKLMRSKISSQGDLVTNELYSMKKKYYIPIKTFSQKGGVRIGVEISPKNKARLISIE